jgi:hypothetical protein
VKDLGDFRRGQVAVEFLLRQSPSRIESKHATKGAPVVYQIWGKRRLALRSSRGNLMGGRSGSEPGTGS